MVLNKLSLQFALHETEDEDNVLEAYERLIHDAMSGDQTLFTSAEGIERLWEVSAAAARGSAARAPLRPGQLGTRGDARARRARTPGDCRSSVAGANARPPTHDRARSAAAPHRARRQRHFSSPPQEQTDMSTSDRRGHPTPRHADRSWG